MSDYLHGIKISEETSGARYIRTIDSAVIGLLATGDDADAEAFPLDKPVLITNIAEVIGKAGTSGTLAKSLYAINKQGNCYVIVVRVAENEDSEQQEALLIGEYKNGTYTGAKAFLTANNVVRKTPRIIGCPQLDTQAVTTELVTIAKKLGAFVYAHAIGETKEAAANYEKNFSARELMLIYGDFIGFDESKKKTVTIDSVAVALGLRAAIDHEIGWHKTLSNIPVNGVTGTTANLNFSLIDPANDANYLNSNCVSALINEDGFRFWGNRTTDDITSPFSFESATRTAQILSRTMADAFLWAMDKPLTQGLASDIIMTIDNKLKEMTTAGRLLGGEAWYDPSRNTPNSLKNGELYISYDYTPVPPLESLHLAQKITDIYFIDFNKKIAKEIGGRTNAA